MSKIPTRYGHFLYGVVQSSLTCAVAASIACYPFIEQGSFARHWFRLWGFSWMTMLPVVIFAAPVIRKITDRLTSDKH
jgi:hypothetical protein